MLKLIYHNLIANWRRNIWLLLQISIIAYIAWILLDPVLVKLYVKHLDPGYDIERLVQLNISEYPIGSSQQPEEITHEEKMEHLNRILAKVKTHPDIEAATLINPVCFEQMSTNSSTFTPNDAYILVYFIPGTDFFKTFGLKDASTSVMKDFIEPPMTGNHAVISKSIAEYNFSGENPIGQILEKNSPYFEKYKEYSHTVSGVVNDAIYRSVFGRSPIAYYPMTSDIIKNWGGVSRLFIVMRLKEGINADDFATSLTSYANSDLKSGPVYTHGPQSYTVNRKVNARDDDNSIIINGSIALFFFVNVLLGMMGTFYLQTRKRSMDAGILRSFGGSKRFVICEMIFEGLVMVTIACLIAFTVYYFQVHESGLTALNIDGEYSAEFKGYMALWIDSFNKHFLIISGIIYAIMLISVLIGIYIPARRISRINPVDALRDE